jgi:hypothetical protein
MEFNFWAFVPTTSSKEFCLGRVLKPRAKEELQQW